MSLINLIKNIMKSDDAAVGAISSILDGAGGCSSSDSPMQRTNEVQFNKRILENNLKELTSSENDDD